jgi:hypothetical protein
VAEREEQKMIKVRIEVHSGSARFGVAVQAQSIHQALSLAGAKFPGRTCRVKFPIEAEGFFVEGACAREEMVEQVAGEAGRMKSDPKKSAQRPTEERKRRR